MTQISSHVYSAVLDDATPLSITGGTVTLDADRIPYVTANVTFAVEDAMLLDDLDPRDGRRIVLTCAMTAGEVTRSRSFDLGIRDVTPNRADGTVQVALASDETLLDDYAQLVDDETPFTLASSLRAVVDYVLDKIDAGLEPSPTIDADVTPHWKATNLLLNPSVQGTGGAPWTAAGNCTVFQASIGRTGTSSSGYMSTGAGQLAVAADAYPNARQGVTPGKTYIFSGYGVRYQAPTARTMTAVIRFYDENGATLWADYESAPASLADDTVWTRATVRATAPVGAAKAATFFRVNGSTAAGQIGYIDDAMFYEGTRELPFFYGDTPDDAGYVYDWTKDANASHSVRTPHTELAPEALVWSAGVSAMEFIATLLKTVGYRLVCDEQRRWTLRDEEYRADGVQTWRYGVNITAADEKLSRDDETWFDAAVYVYSWTDRDGIPQTRTDAYTLTPTPAKVLRRELNTAYPGPGRAQQMVQRAQGKGRTVTVSGIPSWAEQTDQPLSILLDGTPIQTGITSSIRFDLDTDEVTVTSRTTDTPAAAWILIPDGETWLDSPAGESWKEEVI